MRNKMISVLLALLLLLSLAAGVFAGGQEKVDVCHKAGTEHQAQISVAGAALDAHLDHGDYTGTCRDISEKSDLCNILDGLGGTFYTGENIYYRQEFTGTNLFDTETVTLTVFNNDNYLLDDHWIRGSIVSATGSPTYKSLSYADYLRLGYGETGSAALTNNNDPGSETNFLVTVEHPSTGAGGEPIIRNVVDGSLSFVLSCS